MNERFVEKRVPRNAFRRNAMCVDTTSQRKSFPQSYKNHKKLYLKFLKFVIL